MNDDNIKQENWYTEKTKGVGFSFEYEQKIVDQQSKFQRIEVYKTKALGKILLLDGKTMVSERDEFAYHEMIAHVPLYTHKNPKKVLIIGGGDGGTLREVLRHSSVQEVTLVEIDSEVIDVCKDQFPNLTSSFQDPRVNILNENGIEYIQQYTSSFDIIIVDSGDPEKFALGLFSTEFYQSVYEALKYDGIMSCQTDNPFLNPKEVRQIYQNLIIGFEKDIFIYIGYCLIYPGSFWSWGLATKQYHPQNDFRLDQCCKDQFPTKYYNHGIHLASFQQPNFIQELLQQSS